MNREELVLTIQNISREEFSRSGGPGGQNVNKVNTQVTLRVPVGPLAEALSLSASDVELLSGKLAGRINDSGELVLQVSDTRSQRKNRDIAIERAADMVGEALVRPRKRRRTRPSATAKARRLDAKRRRSQTKRDRRVDHE